MRAGVRKLVGMNGRVELGTMLSIWAHPDDETYLAGGVMAAAADRGQRVVCVSATAGECGTDDPASWPPERLGRVRRWEAAAAMAVLGVRDHRIIGLPDGRLTEFDAAGREHVARLFDEVQPDVVLTFGPDGVTFHPDHIAVHRWVTDEWEARGRPCQLLYAASSAGHLARHRRYYEDAGIYMRDVRPVGRPAETLAIQAVLRGTALDRKLAALRAMATQTSGAIAAAEPGVYDASVAEEAFVDAADFSGSSFTDLEPALAA